MRQWPALTPPCPLSRGVEPCRVSLALRRCAPGSSRARPPPHMADKICRASMGSVSVQTAGWRSCVSPHSHALASHICGTRWSSWVVFLASGYFSWACSLSVDHLSSCPLRVSAQPVALFGVLGTSVPLSDAFHHGSTTAGTPYTTVGILREGFTCVRAGGLGRRSPRLPDLGHRGRASGMVLHSPRASRG